jgi:hypothetical protein
MSGEVDSWATAALLEDQSRLRKHQLQIPFRVDVPVVQETPHTTIELPNEYGHF